MPLPDTPTLAAPLNRLPRPALLGAKLEAYGQSHKAVLDTSALAMPLRQQSRPALQDAKLGFRHMPLPSMAPLRKHSLCCGIRVADMGLRAQGQAINQA